MWIRGGEVGEDDDEGEDELEAEVGHACLLELVVGPVDPIDQGRTRDGPAALGAHIQGGSEGHFLICWSSLLWNDDY